MLAKHPYKDDCRRDEQGNLKRSRQSQKENNHRHQRDVHNDQKNPVVIREETAALYHGSHPQRAEKRR
jgi:hypothetical protein